MLNIIDNYGKNSELFLNSLWQVGMNHPTIALEDDGYLPKNVYSVFQFFMGEIDQQFHCQIPEKYNHPLFFNEVPIPRFWEIEGDNSSASILDGHHLRGKIFYAEPLHLRQVKRVDWYDEGGKVRVVDCYNQYGRKYCEMVFDAEQKLMVSLYYHLTGKEAIIVNHVTQDVVLHYQGAIVKFNHYLELVQFFLNECEIEHQELLFNTLSHSFFVANSRKEAGRNWLFWQEPIHDQIPGNMLSLLNAKHYRGEVLVLEQTTYEKLQQLVDPQLSDRIHLIGYSYRHSTQAKAATQVLIFTNSDQIEQLPTIVNQLPELHFHIAAITEMSSKLAQMELNANVTLYPNITPAKVEQLWEIGDLYLDINHGGEILSAVENAYLNNLLIYAFENTMHNAFYIAPEHRYKVDQVKQFIGTLKSVHQEEASRQQAMKLQQRHANEISIAQLEERLAKLFK